MSIPEAKDDNKSTVCVYINGRFLTMPVTGVQRYALELLDHVDCLLDEVANQGLKLVCLVPPGDFPQPSWNNIEVRVIGKHERNLWEQFDLPLYLNGELLFSPANIGPWHYANQVVTIHDASVFAVSDAYSFAFRAKYRFILKQLAKRAAFLLTVSDFSRQELAHYLKVSPDRFSAIPHGSDHLVSVEPDPDILRQNNLEAASYLLLVSSRSRHKNIDAVVQAVGLLDQDVRLVVVGGNFSKVFKSSTSTVNSDKMLSLGYITDRELKALYENALGFVFPSLYEGFGLPVLEAMRAGCPVICSSAASLPEVAGDAALYFDPEDVGDIARTIKYFLSTPDLQEDLRKKGLQRAEKLEWSAAAAQVLDSIRRKSENK